MPSRRRTSPLHIKDILFVWERIRFTYRDERIFTKSISGIYERNPGFGDLNAADFTRYPGEGGRNDQS